MDDGPQEASRDPRIRRDPPIMDTRDRSSLLAPMALVIVGGLMVYTITVTFDLGAVLFGGTRFLDVLDLNALLVVTLYLAGATLMMGARDARREHLRKAEAAEHVRRMNDLESSDLRRRTFLSEITHELNTPLTPIDLHLDLLAHGKHGDLTKQQAHAVASVKRSMGRLSQLIADMLDMTRIENGRMRLERRTVHVDRLVAETGRSYAPLAEGAGVRLVVDAVEDDPHTAELDEHRIGQVLDNLVTNALKFTPKGGLVHLGCSTDGEQVVITVADTGRGLERGVVEKIFEPFEQVQGGAITTNPGVGLGLYIAQGIVEAHGGTISCSSDGKGHGATFTVRLPCTPPAGTARADATSESDEMRDLVASLTRR